MKIVGISIMFSHGLMILGDYGELMLERRIHLMVSKIKCVSLSYSHEKLMASDNVPNLRENAERPHAYYVENSSSVFSAPYIYNP